MSTEKMTEGTDTPMVAVPQPVMNAIVEYMMARPYNEVVDIIARLQQEAVAVNMNSEVQSDD